MRSLLALMLVAGIACNGSNSAPGDAATDGAPTPTGSCLARDLPPLPAEPTSCAATTPEVCPLTARECPLQFMGGVLADLNAECGVYCGDGGLGLRNGCVVEVDMRRVGTLQGTSQAAAKECVRDRLLGARWTCNLGDGWWSLFLGSCTVP